MVNENLRDLMLLVTMVIGYNFVGVMSYEIVLLFHALTVLNVHSFPSETN